MLCINDPCIVYISSLRYMLCIIVFFCEKFCVLDLDINHILCMYKQPSHGPVYSEMPPPPRMSVSAPGHHEMYAPQSQQRGQQGPRYDSNIDALFNIHVYFTDIFILFSVT